MIRLLCLCADGDTLFELYDQERARLDGAKANTRMSSLSRLYDAVSRNRSHEAHRIMELLMKDLQRAQNEFFKRTHPAVPLSPSQEPDDTERWRMLNELEEAELYEAEGESICDDDAWAELLNSKEDDPFAAFGEFADFDEDAEEALDQLDEDWDEN